MNELRCLIVKKTDMSTYIVIHNVILAVFFFQIAMFPIVMYVIGFFQDTQEDVPQPGMIWRQRA